MSNQNNTDISSPLYLSITSIYFFSFIINVIITMIIIIIINIIITVILNIVIIKRKSVLTVSCHKKKRHHCSTRKSRKKMLHINERTQCWDTLSARRREGLEGGRAAHHTLTSACQRYLAACSRCVPSFHPSLPPSHPPLPSPGYNVITIMAQ